LKAANAFAFHKAPEWDFGMKQSSSDGHREHRGWRIQDPGKCNYQALFPQSKTGRLE
jgi:hypothetical protein